MRTPTLRLAAALAFVVTLPTLLVLGWWWGPSFVGRPPDHDATGDVPHGTPADVEGYRHLTQGLPTLPAPLPPSPTPARGLRGPTPRHLVLISLDTVRADHLGAYGHPARVTPTLDRLAAEGVRFDRHISAAPTTLASHTSLFTGLWPHRHTVPRNDHVVPDHLTLLQEHLAAQGFHGAAFLGAMPLASHSGFTQGFQVVDETFSLDRVRDEVGQTMRPGEETLEALSAWLSEADLRQRQLLFVHFFDAHAPYRAPSEHLALGGAPGHPRHGTMRHVQRVRTLARRGLERRLDVHHAVLRRRYLAGISHVDRLVAGLLETLDAAGWLDDALVVVTADHGETFHSDTEVWDHGEAVTDQTVHTPLILWWKDGRGGGRGVADVVSNVDVLPSLLELLGLPVPDGIDGLSFVPTLRDPATPHPREVAFAEATKPHLNDREGWQNAPMAKAATTRSHKLVRSFGGRAFALYDLRQDPAEVHDVLALQPSVADALRAALEDWGGRSLDSTSPRVTDASVQAELAALGYVDDVAEEVTDSDAPSRNARPRPQP